MIGHVDNNNYSRFSNIVQSVYSEREANTCSTMVRPKSHEENRHVVCALCFAKSGTMRKVSELHKNTISEYFISDFKKREADYPDVICGTCRIVCDQYAAGNFTRKINLHKYEQKSFAITRSKQKCSCHICETARSTIKKVPEQVKRGRPRLTEMKSKNVKRICNDCLSEIGRGKKHFCNVSERVSNLNTLLDDNPSISRAGEAAVSNFLNAKTSAAGSSTIQLRNRRGKPSIFQKNR